MHSCEHRRSRGYHAQLADEGPLQVAVTATLAEAAAIRVDRHAARDDEINGAERLRPDGLAESCRAPDGRSVRELPVESPRIELDEAPLRAEPWHGHEDDLAVPQG